MDPPVPIPNTVVKHSEAESTCLETGWEDRKLLVKLKHPAGCFFAVGSYWVLPTAGRWQLLGVRGRGMTTLHLDSGLRPDSTRSAFAMPLSRTHINKP